MNKASLRLLLTSCALLGPLMAAPALAQDGPQDAPQVIVPAPAVEDAEDATGEPGAIVIEAPPIPADAEPAIVPIPAVWSPAPWTADGQSVYGLYLNGRLASFRGDRTTGAALLSAAQAMVPEQPALADEAFREGLFAGDLDEVVRLTPMIRDTPQLAEAGRFVEVVQSFRRGDARTSLALMQGEGFTEFFGIGVRFLKPIVAAAAGDWDTALAPVVASPRDPAGFILRLNRAQLMERRRMYDEAEAEFRSLSTNAALAPYVAVPYGAFLERRGRKSEAVAVYDAALNGEQTDAVLRAARDRTAERRRPPALPSLLNEGADALVFIAGGAKQAEASDLAIIYLRLAESLRPDGMTAYELGEALAKAHREQPAREAFARVMPADRLVYAEAQHSMGESFARDGKNEEALEAFRRADLAVPHQARFALALSGQLLAMERTQEALAVLDRAEINTENQHPLVRFQRGAALETLGRYDEAEGELWAALQAAPDNAIFLNYLGYMWVDTGRRVAQGAEMLERAHAAEPENGNIQDSLGWAQFRQGQYDTAVVTLEGAVDKLPANAEINDHLGDAYWQVGRRREAEWQWNRVLTLAPDAERRTEVERKLADGLPEPHRLGRRGAQQQDGLGLQQHQRPLQEGQAGGLFLRRRRAVAGRTPEDTVHLEGAVRQAGLGQHTVEQTPGGTVEDDTGTIFGLARRIADDQKGGGVRPGADDGALSALLLQAATVEAFRSGGQGLHGHGLCGEGAGLMGALPGVGRSHDRRRGLEHGFAHGGRFDMRPVDWRVLKAGVDARIAPEGEQAFRACDIEGVKVHGRMTMG